MPSLQPWMPRRTDYSSKKTFFIHSLYHKRHLTLGHVHYSLTATRSTLIRTIITAMFQSFYRTWKHHQYLPHLLHFRHESDIIAAAIKTEDELEQDAMLFSTLNPMPQLTSSMPEYQLLDEVHRQEFLLNHPSADSLQEYRILNEVFANGASYNSHGSGASTSVICVLPLSHSRPPFNS